MDNENNKKKHHTEKILQIIIILIEITNENHLESYSL